MKYKCISAIIVFLATIFFFSYGGAQTGSATLTWTDNCVMPKCQEDGFVIERSVNKGTFSVVSKTGADITTATDTVPLDPTADIEACFRVAAFNKAGQSGYSNTACAILKQPLPADPTNLLIQLQQALKAIFEYKPQ